MANKRKTTTAIVAGVTAVALLLGGTFAWTSIQQEARNEAIVDINPGGRLHDDFNGTNKDVYVENFGDTTTGVPIYARIRLDEYMEIGQDAGKKTVTEGTTRKATSIIGADADINNTSTWTTYIPTADSIDGTLSAGDAYWTWQMGNDSTEGRYYMPTFNKNKDSLKADINGTYEGTVAGDSIHYDDYKVYGVDSSVLADEEYDFDDDTEDEENPSVRDDVSDPWNDHDVYRESNTHTAQQISTSAEVITMAQWMASEDEGGKAGKPGPYWVYDTDGWAYWAQAIAPGETTGLLLDGISMSKVPDDSWYYGINVVGQFATASDLSAFNSGKTDDETWTPAAEELFAKIANVETVIITSDTIDDENRIGAGQTDTFSATRTVAGVAAESQPTFTWTATDADGEVIEGVSIDKNGYLTVDSAVPDDTEITVTASAGELKGSAVLTVVGVVNFTAVYNDNDLGSLLAEYHEGYYYSQVVTVNNTSGDKVLYTIDDEIDWDKTLATDYSNQGITLAKTEAGALEVSFNGAAFNNRDIGWNTSMGKIHQYVRVHVHTTDGKEVLLEILENMREEPSIQMSYIRGDAEAQTIDANTVLQTGDILVMSVDEEIVAKNTGSRYVFKEGSEYTTNKIMKLSDGESKGDNTLRYAVTVLDDVTTEQSVMIRFYPELKYGDDYFPRVVKYELNVKVAPNPTAE